MSIELVVDGTRFRFPEGWRAEKFDEWRHFKAVSGYGIQGCDIAAVNSEELWLIEVKDYTYPGAREPKDLDKTIARKAVGTLALLSALARSQNESDAQQLSRNSQACTKIILTLHIEPNTARRARNTAGPYTALQQNLRRVAKKLNLAHSVVTSTQLPAPNVPWSSQRDPETRAQHVGITGP